MVLISLVQDLEIIINAERKNFQHHKPESIVLYMVGGWGLGGKQWNRFGEYFSFPPNIGHLKLKYILPVELFVILLKKSFLWFCKTLFQILEATVIKLLFKLFSDFEHNCLFISLLVIISW